MADKRGYRNRYRGMIDRDELHRYFRDQGCLHTVCSPSDWRWEKSVTYGQALQEFRERLFAEFWDIPDEAYLHMTDEVEAWIITQPNGLDTVEEMQPYLVVDIYQLPTR